MIKIIPLFSGSSGNSTLIQTSHTSILLDCGVSCKMLSSRLANWGVRPSEISAIVISHEHSDHITALKTWTAKNHTKVYLPPKCLVPISQSCCVSDVEVVTQGFFVGDIWVEKWECSHDAKQCFGYRFSADGQSVACVTDTGIFNSSLVEFLSPCKTIMLESNHDLDMLWNGPYPYTIKQRIASEVGHLSNVQAAEVLQKLLGSSVKNVVLAHLSQHNNTKELAFSTMEKMYQSNGIKVGQDINLFVADKQQNEITL